MSATPRLAYTLHPGNGPHLALLHGFLSSSSQWNHNLEALGDLCTPVTIDLWGHGKSPAPEDPKWYSPAGYLQQLEQIRAEIGVQSWLLCGYSLGAGITIRYAAEYPQRVIAHAFTNSTSGFADREQVSQWQQDGIAAEARIIEGGMAAIARIAVHPRFAKRLPPDLFEALVADAAGLDPLGVARTIRYTTPAASIRDIAGSNRRPALLCFGSKERRFVPLKDWAVQNMTQLQVAELDAGHAVNMEDAAGFNLALSAFIGRNRA